MKELVCLIPAKHNSERCKLKNIRPFARTSLVEIKIEQAKRVGMFDKIVVDTDSDEIMEIAASHGVSFVKRPYEFTVCGNHEFHQYMARTNRGKILCVCHCTSPCLKDSTLEKCVKLYMELGDETASVNTALEMRTFLFDGG